MKRLHLGGFTLLELLIAIVIVGVSLTVATPSIKRYLETQRLKSITSELLVDAQFARSEAVARGRAVGIKFSEVIGDRTCYTIADFNGTSCQALAMGAAMANCDCANGIGTACTAGPWTEIRTVTVPYSRTVKIKRAGGPSPLVAFDPTSGNMTYCNVNLVAPTLSPFNVDMTSDSGDKLRVEITQTGRPKSCKMSGAIVGVPAC